MLQSASISILAATCFAASSILSSGVAAPAQSSQPQRERMVAEIRAVIQAQQDAWNRGNIDGFMKGYARSRSTIFVSEDTVTRDWQTVRDRYKKKYPIAKRWARSPFPTRRSLGSVPIRPLRSEAGN